MTPFLHLLLFLVSSKFIPQMKAEDKRVSGGVDRGKFGRRRVNWEDAMS